MIKIIGQFIVCMTFLVSSQLAWSNNVIQGKRSIAINIHDKERLQRGARTFINYCAGCHSLKYMRYDQMGKDIGLVRLNGSLDEELLKNNLIATQATTVHSTIISAMLPEDSKQWFGAVPPDLSLITRSRGSLWLYNYLYGFYDDRSQPFGTNNLLLPNVAMPNVLESLIGKMILMPQDASHAPSLLLVKPGEMLVEEFDNTVYDLVTFLVYVGEPSQLIRYKLGGWVLAYLLLLLLVAYFLKKMYWQRIP